MLNQYESNTIRNIETSHDFVCFRLRFIDPLVDPAFGTRVEERIPYSAIHMVQRDSGLRSALYFRIEDVTYDRVKHDDYVVRAILTQFVKDLFNGDLADYMPALSPDGNVYSVANEESLDRIYTQLSQGIWNAVTTQLYTDPIQFSAGGFNASRLNVSFGNGLGFIMTLNKNDLYRGARRLSGTVQFLSKRHHFAFIHSELSGEALEGLLKPEVASKMLRETFDKYAPMFNCIEYELRFAD